MPGTLWNKGPGKNYNKRGVKKDEKNRVYSKAHHYDGAGKEIE